MSEVSPSSQRKDIEDVWLVVIASLAFATSGPLGKVARELPPVAVACARTGIASILLALAARGALVRDVRALTGKQRGAVLLAGVLLAAHFALFLAGLDGTSLAAAVALISLEPIAVVLAALIAFGIRPTPREILGLVVATAGAFVVASGAGVGEHRVAGDLMVLGAVVLYGAYVAAARGLRGALGGLPYAAVVYGTSSIVLLPIALVMTLALPAGALAAAATPKALGAVVLLGLVPTLVGHTLIQYAARRASPVIVALACPGETIGSLAIGTLVMGAAPSSREAAGAALVIAGATLAVTTTRRR